jgi:CBS domain-containing protein
MAIVDRAHQGDTMKVAKLMNPDVVTCRSVDRLDRAAKLMWERDVGCLPVVDERNHVVGLVTDRDACMAAYMRNEPLSAIPVTAAMAHRVFTCTLDDDLVSVEKTMSERQIRRMPVIDSEGHPIGIITLNDLARAARRGGTVSPVELASTMSAICEPRHVVAS